MENDLILKLYSRAESVFTVSEIAQLCPKLSFDSLRDKLYYFTKIGKLKRLYRGIYTKEAYNSFELANKIYIPSYISLETVLAEAGVVFQHYETVFVVSSVNRAVEVDKWRIQYRKIRKDILTNASGIVQKGGYFIAERERAFLDAVFIYKNYHFDNLDVLDWENVNRLLPLYNSKTLEKRVKSYYKQFVNANVKH